MPFYDTTGGPVVLEIPPADDGSITGSVDDGWQNALEDVGPPKRAILAAAAAAEASPEVAEGMPTSFSKPDS